MIIAIDPGRDKCGWVLADGSGDPVAGGIFPTADAPGFFEGVKSGKMPPPSSFTLGREALSAVNFSIDEWILGDGTGKNFLLRLAQTMDIDVKLVSERGSTLQARNLYWKYYPPRGLRRLLPQGLLAPPRDVDDFAALAILHKYLELRCARSEEDR